MTTTELWPWWAQVLVGAIGIALFLLARRWDRGQSVDDYPLFELPDEPSDDDDPRAA
jgi:hypothetical protein